MPSSPPKENTGVPYKWLHPNEVMQLHRFKARKKQLQARFNKSLNETQTNNVLEDCSSVFANKRKNPFITNSTNKRSKPDLSFSISDESSDQVLFKLLHLSNTRQRSVEAESTSSFSITEECLTKTDEVKQTIVQGQKWIPIDWSLKTKIRFMSDKPFAWNQKLKNSEEASGITGFVRCLDTTSSTSLDTSPNARFHQCCLYWQQPVLPWMNLYPRTTRNSANNIKITTTPAIRNSLQNAWVDSFRSLFQLLRTLQCSYFYVCGNNFTVLFRAVGICGFSEIHAFITPTTRGFRHLLRQEDIEFTMPLKEKSISDNSAEKDFSNELNINEVTEPDEDKWLQSMGINAEDIKQINYTQDRIKLNAECEVDNSEKSLVYVKGVDVNALYNFLINCKSTIATTGPMAGIPPTLISSVAFHGATLCALKVRENKVRVDNSDYHSLELSGPILPHAIHSLCTLHHADNNLTATFAKLSSTASFNKVIDDISTNEQAEASGTTAFGKENLSDCGLNSSILKHFCTSNCKFVGNMECLKYTAESGLYTWS